MAKLIDLSGQIFDRLTVVKRGKNNGSRATWICKCICGNKALVTGKSLRNGTTRSCGCLNQENKPLLKHGYTQNRQRPPEFNLWLNIKRRCLDPNDKAYKNYGARGIEMYQEWIDDFGAFFEYVGSRPTPEYTLDRIDNSKGYEPNNVRWATRAEQNRNKRTNRMLTLNGKTQCLKDWANELGENENFLRSRLNKGMSLEDAISKPKIPLEECNAKMITFNGKTMSIAMWSRETGIPATTLYSRLRKEWSIEKALTTPKK